MAAFSVPLPAEMICHPDYMDSKMFSCEETTLAGVLPPSTVGGGKLADENAVLCRINLGQVQTIFRLFNPITS